MEVSYSDFLEELEKEVNEMANYGISYRYETAKLSLEIARKVSEFNLFLDIQKTIELVTEFLPADTNDERIDDVSKSLNTILRSLHRVQNITEDTEKVLIEHFKNRNKLNLIPCK